MKANKIIKALLAICGVFIFLFSILAAYIHLQGKEIVRRRLEVLLEKPVEIGDVRLSLPLNLLLRDVKVGQGLVVRKIVLDVQFVDPFARAIDLSELVLENPQVFVPRDILREKFSANSSDQSPPQNNLPEKPKDAAPASSISLLVEKLIINNGELYLTGPELGQSQRVADHVRLTAGQIKFPLKGGRTNFRLEAVLATGPDSPEVEGKAQLEFSGWIDPIAKDMDGTIMAQDWDSGLWTTIFGGEHKFLDKAVFDARVDLKSASNDMDVHCLLKVKTINFILADAQNPSLENIIAQGLQSIGQGVELKFNFKTKMDELKMGEVLFTGTAGQPSGDLKSSEGSNPSGL